MVKKGLIIGSFITIILSLFCGLCWAAEGDNKTSINLGNEITKSIDKTGQSMQNLTNNVFSGNNIVNDMKTDAENMGKSVTDEMNRVDDGIVSRTDNNQGDYNVTRTTSEGSNTTMFNAMSTTTWMWIILAVAAIIVIAAIWYYATQNND